MINGIYSSATAMDNYSRQQELIASNLAHLNTPGYRRQYYTFQENTKNVNETLPAPPGAMVATETTDFESGVRKSTGRALDVAINGDAFFVFQGEAGELYSRNGVLFRDPSGKLVNGDGLPILDNGKPIEIPSEVSHYNLVIDSSGQISADGEVFGELSMVNFDDPNLLESDSQIYFNIGQATLEPPTDASAVQGFRELSNAHPVTELISLIIGSRGFEAAQRAIRTISDSIQENIRA